MTSTQKRFTFLFVGIFLLSITFFRVEWFVQNDFLLWVYRILAIGSLIMIAVNGGRLIGRKVAKWALFGLFLSELLMALFFQMAIYGVPMPERMSNFLSYIYLFHCRDGAVHDHDRGRYDETLFYTLKPGEFHFSNMEFSTKYIVNSAGFRDDEASLGDPEIIFLGDSYTMGWGVEQDESFAALLEKKLRKKALDLGVSSYGTARETLAFEGLKHDSCRLAILQFCPNDVKENRSFVENNFHLKVSSPADFESQIVWNRLYTVYFPLKFLHAGIYYFARKIKPEPVEPQPESVPEGGIKKQEVEDFFAILQRLRANFHGNIVVFTLGMGYTIPAVYEQFQGHLTKHPIKGVFIFPSADILTKEDYLILDMHLNKKGNQKLADGLAAFILKNNLLRN